MKSLAPFFIVISTIFSFTCIAQSSRSIAHPVKIKNTQTLVDEYSGDDLAVLYYHVEERINMNFGSTVTTYNVSNLSLVSTTELGANNARIITPKYGRAKAKVVAAKLMPKAAVASINEMPKATVDIVKPTVVKTPEKKLKYVDIDIVGTYERVLDKGYKSVDMLKRAANSRFFGGDLVTAAKWYDKLFSMTTDLEVEYYYRYSQALLSIQETEKANEMLKLFEKKSM